MINNTTHPSNEIVHNTPNTQQNVSVPLPEPEKRQFKPGCLTSKTVMVTGASVGIGRAVSIALAKEGCEVILVSRKAKDLEKVYDEIVALGYKTPIIYAMDLLKLSPEQADELRILINQEVGKLDGIIHNAGALGALTPIEHYVPAEWLKVMQVNLNAPFLLTQRLLPLLKKAPEASVLFTTSSVGREGRAYWGAYSVSKFGTEALTQILASELKTNTKVRVNCINPGKVKTAMRAQAYPAENPNLLALPEQIVSDYIYMMSSESVGITGFSFDAKVLAI